MKPEAKIIVYVTGDVAPARVGEFVAAALHLVRSGEFADIPHWVNPVTDDQAFLWRNKTSFRLNVQSGKVAP